MSGWTILTVRGKQAKNYEYSRRDNNGRVHSTQDLVETMENDDRVRKWTTWKGHVYAYLNFTRYAFGSASELLSDYAEMVDDAVVLGANDTTDTGKAIYFERPDSDEHTDMYAETQGEDGTKVGEIALAIMTARHGILARDPFHNTCGGWYDDHYGDSGTDRLNHSD